jgi:hypothetical protein
MCKHGVISTSQSDSLLLIRVNSCMSIIHRWESTLLPSVVISVHAVVLEYWPYFSVAGDQQGCDFNSVDFDRIRNFNLVDLHCFNPIEFDRFRNFRHKKNPCSRWVFKRNATTVRGQYKCKQLIVQELKN